MGEAVWFKLKLGKKLFVLIFSKITQKIKFFFIDTQHTTRTIDNTVNNVDPRAW